MNFITMQLLDKIKASRVEAQKKNIIYRLVYKIVYKYNTKKYYLISISISAMQI